MTGAGASTEGLNNLAGRAGNALRKLRENSRLCVYCLYLAAIAAGELILSGGVVLAGMAVHLLILAALIAHSSLAAGSRFLYLGLALAPMIRILSLSMPLAKIPAAYWYVIIGIPAFMAAYVVTRLSGHSLREIGLNAYKPGWQLIFSLSGLLLGCIEYRILKPAPLAFPAGPGKVALFCLILLVFTGFLEEIIFRGIMFRALRDSFSDKPAVLLSSGVFAALHITYRSPADVIFVFAVAVVFSLAVIRFKSLFGVSLAHGFTNISLFMVFPYLEF